MEHEVTAGAVFARWLVDWYDLVDFWIDFEINVEMLEAGDEDDFWRKSLDEIERSRVCDTMIWFNLIRFDSYYSNAFFIGSKGDVPDKSENEKIRTKMVVVYLKEARK